MPFEFDTDFTELKANIKVWANALGFAQVGIANCGTDDADTRLQQWLAKEFHGEMSYMARNRELRKHPEKLLPGTVRIISVRMDYLPKDHNSKKILTDKQKGYVSRYALGRDYHKVIRKRLVKLAEKINDALPDELKHVYRAFADSAPVFERHLAAKSGIGWVGKNTMIMNDEAGSWFFLGELFTNIPLPVDAPRSAHCGSCTACIDVCPTNAIIAPYQLDARKCISYLTIEYKGPIDEALRPLIGNRIYGCDDCQLFCPWNKFAKFTDEKDFQPRHNLKDADLIDLFAWTESEFLEKTQGSAIRRIGYSQWLRNIAIALGNAPTKKSIITSLEGKKNMNDQLVKEHINWALKQHLE